MSDTQEELEEWKDIEGFEGLYQVSSLGNIKTLARKDACGRPRHERLLEPTVCTNKRGAKTLMIQLRKEGKNYNRSVGKLVAEAFLGKSNMKAYRLDGDYRNNRKDNLAYMPSQGKAVTKRKRVKP